MAFVLLIIVMTADNINVQHVDSVRFDSQPACEAAKSQIDKEIFQGVSTNVKSVCVAAGSAPHP